MIVWFSFDCEGCPLNFMMLRKRWRIIIRFVVIGGHVRGHVRAFAGTHCRFCVICGHVRSSFWSCAALLGGMCGRVDSFNDYRIGRAGLPSDSIAVQSCAEAGVCWCCGKYNWCMAEGLWMGKHSRTITWCFGRVREQHAWLCTRRRTSSRTWSSTWSTHMTPHMNPAHDPQKWPHMPGKAFRVNEPSVITIRGMNCYSNWLSGLHYRTKNPG